jgi:uncharacterized protein (DUF2267 family)
VTDPRPRVSRPRAVRCRVEPPELVAQRRTAAVDLTRRTVRALRRRLARALALGGAPELGPELRQLAEDLVRTLVPATAKVLPLRPRQAPEDPPPAA